MDRHKQLVNEREEIIDELETGIDHINKMAHEIDGQVRDQNGLIKSNIAAVNQTQKKMNFVMGKLSVLLKTSDNKQLYTIMLLFGVMVFQIVLLIL
jgi:Mg2+ and Co2+ transporter CorA